MKHQLVKAAKIIANMLIALLILILIELFIPLIADHVHDRYSTFVTLASWERMEDVAAER